MSETGGISAVIDGSFDGFLTAVFDHYDRKQPFSAVVLSDFYQQELDMDYRIIETDEEKAGRVFRGIEKKMAHEATQTLYQAALTDWNPDRYTPMYFFTLKGFQMGPQVLSCWQDSHVADVIALSRKAGREAHLFLEFLRFSETKDGILYGAVDPENQILPLIIDHFQDRLPGLPWVIHDRKRLIAALCDGENVEFRETGRELNLEFSETEEQWQELWHLFFRQITVEGRKNARLQQSMMPKKIQALQFRMESSLEEKEGRDISDCPRSLVERSS